MTQQHKSRLCIPSISIHILHTKDDGIWPIAAYILSNFNPHPSYEWWRAPPTKTITLMRFQSTSFIRRMTYNNLAAHSTVKISIHILHTKDDYRRVTFDDNINISIHILHTKDDSNFKSNCFSFRYFNPHPSYEGWQCCRSGNRPTAYFNPHPSYEGWLYLLYRVLSNGDFNPHPSYEGWHLPSLGDSFGTTFQSTSFIRRMTSFQSWLPRLDLFQSTSFIRRMTSPSARAW